MPNTFHVQGDQHPTFKLGVSPMMLLLTPFWWQGTPHPCFPSSSLFIPAGVLSSFPPAFSVPPTFTDSAAHWFDHPGVPWLASPFFIHPTFPTWFIQHWAKQPLLWITLPPWRTILSNRRAGFTQHFQRRQPHQSLTTLRNRCYVTPCTYKETKVRKNHPPYPREYRQVSGATESQTLSSISYQIRTLSIYDSASTKPCWGISYEKHRREGAYLASSADGQTGPNSEERTGQLNRDRTLRPGISKGPSEFTSRIQPSVLWKEPQMKPWRLNHKAHQVVFKEHLHITHIN